MCSCNDKNKQPPEPPDNTKPLRAPNVGEMLVKWISPTTRTTYVIGKSGKATYRKDWQMPFPMLTEDIETRFKGEVELYVAA